MVGVGNNLLKMGYRSNKIILSDQIYDLANIRTQKIENQFEKSPVTGCDPEINPGNIHQRNLFSNFVLIDRTLRKKLLNHYLAGLQYWNNEVTPQWKTPGISLSATWLLDRRRPACRGREPGLGSRAELREPVLGCKGRSSSGRNHKARVPMPRTGADRPVRAMKAGNAAGAKGSGQAVVFGVQLETGGDS